MWKQTDKGLHRKFELDDFRQAFRFLSKIADAAEEANHHPEIHNTYNVVELWLATHSAGDKITTKDKDLAGKIDDIFTKMNQKQSCILYTDGGARGNPGPAAIGYVICNSDGDVVKKSGKYIGETTNNQAEYRALLEGIRNVRDLKFSNVNVYMDSELIINQLNGSYKVKNEELKPLYQNVKGIEQEFESISYSHVPRSKNKIADQLVNQALDHRQK